MKPKNVQIHAFCDASENAIGAVVYMRSTYENGEVEVKFVASKTKVAPIKRQSIPRQELTGAVILSRLVDAILKALDKEIEVFYWSDSMTVLYWILNHKPWKQYVQHRVQEIRRLSNHGTWRFCPGISNPADLPSRGMACNVLATSSMW